MIKTSKGSLNHNLRKVLVIIATRRVTTSECRRKKKDDQAKKDGQANSVEEHLVVVTSEVNLVANEDEWWVDTGGTRHICGNRNLFKKYEKVGDEIELYMGNSTNTKVAGKGNVELKFTSGKIVTLLEVYHAPEIRKNLVSGGLLSKHGYKLVFESDKFILSKKGVFVGKGYAANGMFKLNLINKSVSVYIVDSFSLWHARLGHVNYDSVQRMISVGLLPTNLKYDKQKCETCVKTKLTRKPFPNSNRISNNLLELVHSNICDLHSKLTRGGKRYFITFIDDLSKYTYVYLLRTKDEALEKFKLYKSEVENHLGCKIKTLQSDRGGEYFSLEFDNFYETHGIIHQSTALYTPQQNGVAERKNRTLMDMVNAMLEFSGLPYNLWGEALFFAAHILNRIPSKRNKVSPYELWFKQKPNLNYFKL